MRVPGPMVATRMFQLLVSSSSISSSVSASSGGMGAMGSASFLAVDLLADDVGVAEVPGDLVDDPEHHLTQRPLLAVHVDRRLGITDATKDLVAGRARVLVLGAQRRQ